MLSESGLSAWYSRLHISSQARSVNDQVRSSQPARQVGGGSRNVSGRYPSRKMGFTIQFESHRVELAGIYEMEHDHRCWSSTTNRLPSSWTILVRQVAA
jgi:putative transposase